MTVHDAMSLLDQMILAEDDSVPRSLLADALTECGFSAAATVLRDGRRINVLWGSTRTIRQMATSIDGAVASHVGTYVVYSAGEKARTGNILDEADGWCENTHGTTEEIRERLAEILNVEEENE